MAKKDPSQTRILRSYSSGQTFAREYRLVEELGGDAFTETWLAERIEGERQLFVLKIVRSTTQFSPELWQGWIKTQQLIQKISSGANRLIPIAIPEGTDEIQHWVMPYLPGGPVSNLAGDFSEVELAQLMRDVASGVALIHRLQPPIIHQAIHCENILRDTDQSFVLTDTALNYLRRPPDTAAPEIWEKQAYLAPECWRGFRTRAKSCDVFALGVSLFFLSEGSLPFGEAGGKKLLEGGEVPELSGKFSERFNQIVLVCLAKEPEGRPTMSTLLNLADAFLENGRWISVSGFSFPAPRRTRRRPWIIRKNRKLIGPPNWYRRLPSIKLPPLPSPKSRKRLGLLALLLVLLVSTIYVFNKVDFQTRPEAKIAPRTEPDLSDISFEETDLDKLKELVNGHNRLIGLWNELIQYENNLTVIDQGYLDRIKSEINAMDTQLAEKVVFKRGSGPEEVLGWLPEKYDEIWLAAKNNQWQKYVNNLEKMKARLTNQE